MFRNIQSLTGQMNNFSCKHCYRECNQAAAVRGQTMRADMFWKEQLPLDLASFFLLLKYIYSSFPFA